MAMMATTPISMSAVIQWHERERSWDALIGICRHSYSYLYLRRRNEVIKENSQKRKKTKKQKRSSDIWCNFEACWLGFDSMDFDLFAASKSI
jgi:hypothetical protein